MTTQSLDLHGSYIQEDRDRGSDDHEEQGLHVRYPEKAKDTTYLSESGELYGWTDPRRRLPVTEENRMRDSNNQFPLYCAVALVRSDTENRQVGRVDGYSSDDLILILEISVYGRFLIKIESPVTGSSKDRDGDTSFQWSQFTTQCSHLMLPSKDIHDN
ncbi:hypothetical protein Tco_0635235 [Tanacetum coccineum]